MMKPKATVWKLFFLSLFVLALLSCMGFGGEKEEAIELIEPEDSVSPPPREDGPKITGAEKRESAADESGEAPWSGESEAGEIAEAVPEEKAAPSGTIPTRSSGTSTRPQVSGLKAGFADDNKQFNYFVQFLSTYGAQVNRIPIPIEERIMLKVQDSEGKSIPNAEIEVYGPNRSFLGRGTTYADGSFFLFPAEYGDQQGYTIEVTYNQQRKSVSLDRFGRREIPIAFGAPRAEMSRIPLDLLFILDTTGSMGEEIQRLKTTIELIKLNLASLSSKPRVRFGMVLYKDRGDEYVNEVVPFTENLQEFQSALDAVEASGGGDTPEDLQSALEQAMKLSWSRGGVRLGLSLIHI